MTDRVVKLLDSETPHVERSRYSEAGFTIFAIWYGYQRDTLRDLFPILVIADESKGAEMAMSAVKRCISKGSTDASKQLAVNCPCSHGGNLPDPREIKSSIKFYRLLADEQDGVHDRSEGTARQIREDLIDDLDGEDLFTGTVDEGAELFTASFTKGYKSHNFEVQLPFPDDPPSRCIDDPYDIQIPCYIITNKSMSKRTKTKWPDMQWHFPIG